MSLESLGSGFKNIEDLHPVEAHSRSKAVDLYYSLQESELWDSERLMWKRSTEKTIPAEEARRYAEDQLLGILIQGMFEGEHARERYERLKRSKLYDKKKDQWHVCFEKNEKVEQRGRYGFDQLLCVLIEGMFDIHKAKLQYEKLKKSPQYDAENEQWNNYFYYYRSVPEVLSQYVYCSDQLLGVLAEGLFNKHKAFTQYIQLQETPLYEKDTGRWFHCIYANQTPVSRPKEPDKVTDQLVGILAEGIFDIENASNKYAFLKRGRLYDSTHRLWFDDFNGSGDLRCLARDQLLGVWVEKMFEDNFKLHSKEEAGFALTGERLPVVRRF